MEKIKEVTICLHCGCSQEIVDNQIKILSPLSEYYKIQRQKKASYKMFLVKNIL